MYSIISHIIDCTLVMETKNPKISRDMLYIIKHPTEYRGTTTSDTKLL